MPAANADKGWQRKFEDPIPLADGRTLLSTLRDTADYHEPSEKGI